MFNNILLIFNKKIKKDAIVIIFLLFLASLMEGISLGATLPILKYIFSSDIQSENFKFLNEIIKFIDIKYLLLVYFAIFILKNFINIFISWKQASFVAELKFYLSKKFILGYLGLEYQDYKKKNSADLIRNITSEIGNFSGAIQNIIGLILEFLTLVIIISILFFYNKFITLIVFVSFFSFSLLYLIFFKKFLKKIGSLTVHYSAEVIKDIQNCFLNFKIIKLLANPNIFADNFLLKNNKLINSLKLLAFIQSLTKQWLEIFIISIFTLIFFLMSNDYYQIDILALTLFFIAALKIMPSINRIINYLQKLKFLNATIKAIFKECYLFDKNNYNLNKNLEEISLSLNFNDDLIIKNLDFSYNKDRKIIEKLNLTIKNSSLLCIVGKSGSGKTTLVELICGLIDPINGEISLGKKNIFQNRKIWQREIAYVPQKTHLIEDTIEKNILFTSNEKNFDINKFNSILDMCSLKDFVDSLENGAKTILNEQAMNISGGQAQRIGIARALYQNSKILIFDEAFNALDQYLAKTIISNIKKNFYNKKIIIISHEKSIKEVADQILNLDEL
tara:strand:- start:125 stop:1810 length:1686 start_codon:yes stop_codon:yes gene_type:complete